MSNPTPEKPKPPADEKTPKPADKQKQPDPPAEGDLGIAEPAINHT